MCGHHSLLFNLFPTLLMSRFVTYITVLASSTFMMASFLNARLVYNAAFYAKSPAALESVVMDHHTDHDTGIVFKSAVDTNMRELRKFYTCVSTPEKCKVQSN